MSCKHGCSAFPCPNCGESCSSQFGSSPKGFTLSCHHCGGMWEIAATQLKNPDPLKTAEAGAHLNALACCTGEEGKEIRAKIMEACNGCESPEEAQVEVDAALGIEHDSAPVAVRSTPKSRKPAASKPEDPVEDDGDENDN